MTTYRSDIKRIANWIKDDLNKSLEEVFLNNYRADLYSSEHYKVINEGIQLEERPSKQHKNGVLFSFAPK